ncbi:MAG: ATP-binding cassette domain-containing protein, partial [Bifidobacteriaceae bacterium]|nr:ATP-binding cassette domain-containing protein [Bifidobacteriaceae bacterium]
MSDIQSKETEGLSQGQIVRRRFLRHRGAMASLAVLILVVLLAATSIGWGPIPGWWKWGYTETHPVARPGGAPTLQISLSGGPHIRIGDFPFGQDVLGHDMFAMTMRGVQQSLTVMVVIGVVATLIGIVVGATAGYFRGKVDTVLMRFTDMVIAIPVMVIGAVLGKGVSGAAWFSGAAAVVLGLALACVQWMAMGRLVRAEFLSLREREFVDAARVAGAAPFRIIARHILPNAVGVIIVNTTLLMSSAILLETALSYLGFGIHYPDISLGNLISEYQAAFTERPWLFWWPGLFIVVIALTVNFIGDGLRDAFDPRQRRIPSKRRLAKAAPVAPAVASELQQCVSRETNPRSGDLSRPAGGTTSSTKEPAEPGGPDVVLNVADLSVDFYVEGEWYPAARDVSYQVRRGEVLAIVGESGSGKTQSSMALLGLLPPNGRARGSAKLGGLELVGLQGRDLHRVRGDRIAVIFQEPMTALNPVYTIGFQISETLRAHEPIGPKAAHRRALELLRLVDMPDPERRLDAYPHQLSGGQRQRAMIAQALALDPELLIADEPTTALDVTVQAEILDLLRDLKTRINAGIVLITHDMGVVADLADRICVMKDGRLVERGTAEDIFYRPQHPYTRALLDAVPKLTALSSEPSVRKHGPVAKVHDAGRSPSVGKRTTHDAGAVPALATEGLSIEYPKRGRAPAFRAVEDFTLRIAPGEVVGLVGESGSGKTTVGRAAVGLLPVAAGSLKVGGVELAGAGAKELRRARTGVSIVFQDPGSSLNPRWPIGQSIGEPLVLHDIARGKALSLRVEELLDQVQLPASLRNRYPHELSGGQRQRVGIARALALRPSLLIADEPTSALDVSVQATVLELFAELQREVGFACLFITHDLAVVELVAGRV